MPRILERNSPLGAGLVVEAEERFTFRVPPLEPPKSHILGRARRPAAEAPELTA